MTEFEPQMPTTEDILSIYTNWVPYSFERGKDEFYLWLNQHDSDIRARERARLLKIFIDSGGDAGFMFWAAEREDKDD